VSKNTNVRSDIDIAVITREENRNRCIEIWGEIMGHTPDVYDIKIFELLPLQIQASVIQRYEIVFGDRLDILERTLKNLPTFNLQQTQQSTGIFF